MASRALNLVETTEKVGIEVYKGLLEDAFTTNEQLRESLENVNAMLAREDQGWFSFSGGDFLSGLEIIELHKWSREIREMMAGNPHIKQGYKLRSNFVWQRGIRYAGIPGAKQGRGTNVQARIDNPKNQRNFFSANARELREAALYSDSGYYVLGDDTDYTLQTVPIWEIYGHYANPDDHGEVWAFLRVWDRWEAGVGRVSMRMWYLTDAHPDWDNPDKRPTGLNFAGVVEPVDPHKTMFETHVNGQIGWPFGVPDALSAVVWARLYRDFLVNGKIMSDAMAQFAFKASVSTKTGYDNASAKFAEPSGTGQTAILGATNGLDAVSSAGKGYDFASGNALAAVIAAALEVSMVHLLANPEGGGSYGATSTLDMPTQLAVLARRQLHIDFDKRILAWMGAPDATVTFNSTDSPADLFREIQALLLMWSSGLYAAAPIEQRISELMDILGNTIPAGVIIPNNSDAMDLVTPDRTALPNPQNPNSTAAAGGVSKPNGTSPSQGKSSGVGKTGNANDLRTDKLANMLQQLNDFIISEQQYEARTSK